MHKSLNAAGLVLLAFTADPALAHQDKEAAMTALFSQVDADGNGYLSKGEIQSKTDVTRWLSVSNYGGFEMADVNGDGKLDKSELAEFEADLPVE